MSSGIRSVLLIDDDATVRARLAAALDSAEAGVALCGAVDTAEDALACLMEQAPDLVVLRADLPRMSGLQVTRSIMVRRPTPVIVLADPDSEEAETGFECLRSGAQTLLPRPVAEDVAPGVRQRLLDAARRGIAARRAADHADSWSGVSPVASWTMGQAAGQPSLLAAIVGDGAVRSAVQMLEGGAASGCPILLLTSLDRSFLPGFVRWLDAILPMEVVHGAPDAALRPGVVHVVAIADGMRVSPVPSLVAIPSFPGFPGVAPLATSRTPSSVGSFDFLLASMAESLGAGACAIGLGQWEDDGAMGMLAIRQAGGQTACEAPADNPFASTASLRLEAVMHVGSARALGAALS